MFSPLDEWVNIQNELVRVNDLNSTEEKKFNLEKKKKNVQITSSNRA